MGRGGKRRVNVDLQRSHCRYVMIQCLNNFMAGTAVHATCMCLRKSLMVERGCMVTLNESWRSRKFMNPLLLRWSTLHLEEGRSVDIKYFVALWRLRMNGQCVWCSACIVYILGFWQRASLRSVKREPKLLDYSLSDHCEAKLRIVNLVLQRKLFSKFGWSWSRVHFPHRNV